MSSQEQNVTGTSTAAAPASSSATGSRQTDSSDASLQCKWSGCTETSDSAEALYDHICERHVGRKSTNNLNLTCGWDGCRTTTVKRDHITSHIRVHVPLKPHKCNFCGKSFKRPQDLKKHVKTHADESEIYAPRESNHGNGQISGYRQTNGKATNGGYYDHNSQMHHAAANYTQHHPAHNNYYQPQQQPASYGPVYYQMSGAAEISHNNYDTRKRGFDALNDFFGDAKRHQIDPRSYPQVGSRLMALHDLPIQNGTIVEQQYVPAPQMVAVGGHGGAAPLAQPHYSLPMPNLRTKSDLVNIDHFLDTMQSTVYENPTTAAAAGIHLPGSHYTHQTTNFRQSHSPPQTATQNVAPQMSNQHASIMGPSNSAHSPQSGTPALSPPSGPLSYTSGHSPSSVPGLSPSSTASRHDSASSVNTAIYPILPAVSGIHSSNTPALATLGTNFDNDPRKRFSGGMLQRSAPGPRVSSSFTSAPHSYEPAKKAPSPSYNIDPELAKATISTTTTEATDIASPTSTSASDEAAADLDYENWVQHMRVIEALKKLVQDKLARGDYVDDGEDQEMRDAPTQEHQPLYPVLKAD